MTCRTLRGTPGTNIYWEPHWPRELTWSGDNCQQAAKWRKRSRTFVFADGHSEFIRK